jgi:2,3-bisphosphoglycerate-dependent phosphoglycerate mutase
VSGAAGGRVQAPTRLVVLRHGQTAWNAEQRIQGQLDIGLNDTGRAQAQELGRALADEPLAAIYSSDLQRALHTAQAVASQTGSRLHTDTRLRERHFGRFEGLRYGEIDARWPDDALRWRRREPAFRPGDGESLLDFSARCVAAASELAARHAGEAIALVAHGGVLDALYRAAVGLAVDAPRTWQLGNATINRLLWHGSGFVLVGWNDDTHLSQATPLPPPSQRFGDGSAGPGSEA